MSDIKQRCFVVRTRKEPLINCPYMSDFLQVRTPVSDYDL